MILVQGAGYKTLCKITVRSYSSTNLEKNFCRVWVCGNLREVVLLANSGEKPFANLAKKSKG